MSTKTGTLRNKLIDEVHMGKITFMCPDCGSRFIERTQLKDHIQVVHERNKSHQYPISGKRVGFKHNIDDRIQGVLENDKCSLCEYACSIWKIDMENHIKEVHEENKPLKAHFAVPNLN